MRISILDYNNYEPNEEDINEAADQPGTKLMEKWLNGNTNFWNSFDDDFCDDDELMEIAISQLILRYENITIHQLYFIISYIGHENEWYGSYAIAMKTMQKEFPTWSSEDLHLLVMKEFPDHVTAAEETSHVNRNGIQGPDDNNNNNVNDNNDDFMKEAGKFPPTEVSSPVNMHNNNPFSASVIRKDEIVVGGAFAPYFLDPILHFLSSLLLPPSAPPFSLPPFPSTSMAFYLSPCLPPPLLYPLALLYYFNMSVYRTNFPGQLLLKSRVRLALPQNGAA